MSRRSVWNVPQVHVEVTDYDPELQAPRTKEKSKRMPVRIPTGSNGIGNMPRSFQNQNPRRTIGPAYYSCVVSPHPQSSIRKPQRIVRTPKGCQLVRSEAKPVAAGGSAWPKSGPSAVLQQPQVPATRKRALKQLDFNTQTAASVLGQSHMKRLDSAKKAAAANQNPRVNNVSGETDLRRFALAQSSDRKQTKLDSMSVESEATKLIFSPEPVNVTPWSRFGRITAKIPLSPMLLLSSRKDPAKQAQAQAKVRGMLPPGASPASSSQAAAQSSRKRKEQPGICDLSVVADATEVSKMLDISAYVAYQSRFVNNSDVKKIGVDDSFKVEEPKYPDQLPCTLTSQAAGNAMRTADRFEVQEPKFADQLPCTVTSQSTSNERDKANSDKVFALQIQLNAHDKLEADIAQQQADIVQKEADLAQQKANLSKAVAELKAKRLRIVEKFLNSYACASSVNTCRSDAETQVQATPSPVSVLKSEPVPVPEPITPSRRRSTRLARLSEINENFTGDSDSVPVRNETGVTVLVSEPTGQSPGVGKCEAGQLSGAPVATETSYPDIVRPSPKVMPRRSIVDYEKLRASFPGLMKTPRKTPLKSCKKLSSDLDTPDISRRVQASLELLLDDS